MGGPAGTGKICGPREQEREGNKARVKAYKGRTALERCKYKEKLEQGKEKKEKNKKGFGVLSCEEEIRDGAYWVGLDLSDVQRVLLVLY